jgi:hypothetical protein
LGEVAETEGHHPDVHLSWGRVKLQIWTHKIDGLTESDFILAAKADRVYKKVSPCRGEISRSSEFRQECLDSRELSRS